MLRRLVVRSSALQFRAFSTGSLKDLLGPFEQGEGNWVRAMGSEWCKRRVDERRCGWWKVLLRMRRSEGRARAWERDDEDTSSSTGANLDACRVPYQI
eukprot:scaffold636_cov252-Pinguiococcus_pyrenoidosus.AAC.18